MQILYNYSTFLQIQLVIPSKQNNLFLISKKEKLH